MGEVASLIQGVSSGFEEVTELLRWLRTSNRNEAGLLRWPRIFHHHGVRRRIVSNGAFAVSLVIGAALLALWLDARFPRHELTLHRIVGHAIGALALLCVIPGNVGSIAVGFLVVFALVLPALVYMSLAAVWFVRLTQSSLGGSYR